MKYTFALLFLFLFGCANKTHEAEIGALRVHTLVREFANAHLVVQGDNYFLVDAGLADEAPKLDALLRKEGFDPSQMKAIIVTHGHPDHAGGALYFQKKYSIKIIAGVDQDMLSAGKNLGDMCPNGFIAKRRSKKDGGETYQPTTADLVIEAETQLAPLTGIEGRIIPLPGHTPGSLVVQVSGAVLVGDLFRGSLVGRSPKRHFYMCDLEDNRVDLDKLANEIAPDAETFFVGHFGPLSRKRVQAMLDEWEKK